VSSRHGSCVSLAVLAVLSTPVAGCGDDDDGDAEEKSKPVAGTFVGKVRGTDAFVAVVASPSANGREKRAVVVYACDARRFCEWFSGSSGGNSFTATAEGGRQQAKGRLSAEAATGTVELGARDAADYRARSARATAGLYELTVSRRGKLKGSSAAGVGLTGKSSLPRPGRGTLKLADGRRLKFDVTRSSAGEAIRLKAGQIRLIVLPNGDMKGAGKSRPAAGGRSSSFFIRSSTR
jgi:hypothetical protein